MVERTAGPAAGSGYEQIGNEAGKRDGSKQECSRGTEKKLMHADITGYRTDFGESMRILQKNMGFGQAEDRNYALILGLANS